MIWRDAGLDISGPVFYVLKKYKIALIVFIFIISIFFIPVSDSITLTDSKTGRIVYFISLKECDNFYISFIHSVNRVPVYEYYKVRDKKFVVYKTDFYSYGAGMPEYNPNYNVVIKNGMVTIDNLNIELKEFSIFVGTIANHKIVFPDKEYYLSKFVKPGSSIKFNVKKLPIYMLLRRCNYE